MNINNSKVTAHNINAKKQDIISKSEQKFDANMLKFLKYGIYDINILNMEYMISTS